MPSLLRLSGRAGASRPRPAPPPPAPVAPRPNSAAPSVSVSNSWTLPNGKCFALFWVARVTGLITQGMLQWRQSKGTSTHTRQANTKAKCPRRGFPTTEEPSADSADYCAPRVREFILHAVVRSVVTHQPTEVTRQHKMPPATCKFQTRRTCLHWTRSFVSASQP